MARRGNLRLSTAVEQFLSTKRGRLSPATVSNYQQVLDRFTREVGDLFVENIRAQHVEDWLSRAMRREIAPATYNQLRVTVGLLATAINTALRSGDLLRLTVGDLDLSARTLAVYVSKSRTEDVLPLTEDLAAELEQWLTHYTRALFKAQGRHVRAEDLLFPAYSPVRFTGARQTDEDGHQRRVATQRGYDPTTPVFRPERVVQAALEAVGLPTKGEGLHTIRRSVARLVFDSLSARGHDAALRETAALLHHSSVTVTERYLGLSADRQRRDEHLRTHGVLAPRPVGAEVISLR